MKIAVSRFIVPAMMIAMLIVGSAGVAGAQSPKCSNSITSCGCTIGAPGDYTVDATLSAAQGLTSKGGCIDIEGENVNLDVYEKIVGPGSDAGCDSDQPKRNAGVGIHVLSTAKNTSINFFNVSTYLPAACGWNIGLESEGSDAGWNQAVGNYNNIGMLFKNATHSNCVACDFQNNVTGVEIAGGSGNTVAGGASVSNSQYGIWLNGTTGNTVSEAFPDRNNLAGIYLGCSTKGDVTPAIPCTITATTGNVLANNYSENGNKKYGIAVEKGSIGNEFLENESFLNRKYDFIDGNGNCVYNLYSNDYYNTKSPRCIQ
ncbi:MAG: hypothetical protein ABSD39_16215 [Terriglobales bacterium]|jgi:hypothetical protein